MNHLYDLLTEYHVNPLGIDIDPIRLSWKLPSGSQTAYEITAMSDSGEILWETGRVESDQTVHVVYTGRLAPRVNWSVRVWDDHGDELLPADPAYFEPLPTDLKAKWVSGSTFGGPRTSAPLPILRRAFALAGEVKRARLYVTALGIYEAVLNGKVVSEDVLCPGWTDYHKRVRVQAYDVTDQLQEGNNCLAAWLGDGWYCGHVEWRGRQMYGERPWLFAELRVEYADGRTENISTDEAWRWAQGPILEGDLIMGEAYDARHDAAGWDRPDFDDSHWAKVVVCDFEINLVGTNSPMPRRMLTLTPIPEIRVVKRWPQDDYILDLGQNMTGWIRLKVKGEAGKTIRIRYGEVLDEKGHLYVANLRSARQTDYYTLKGDPDGETWEPRFTFHGFRYVELRGCPGEVTADTVTGVVVYSNLPVTGEFECSNPLVNQLQSNILWGQRGNFVDVPTDCPQRDERLGWTGDAQVFASTAAFNMLVPSFFEKYMQDLADSQDEEGHIPPTAPNTHAVGGDGGPAWADAFLIVPWTMYQLYGEEATLRRHYASMKRFVDSLERDSINLIRSHPDWNGFHGFGDWLNTKAETPNDLIGTAFFAHSAHLMTKIAIVLGESGDATNYQRLSERVKAAWRSRFLTPDGMIVSQTQTAALLALHFDLVPAGLVNPIFKWLTDDVTRRGWHLSTGFVGTPYINHVLSEFGRNDIAYRLLLQESWPSWLYSVTQGATTIWERWDGWTQEKGFQDPGMNSFNHYSLGSVGEWMYATVAGLDLDPAKPGYENVIVHPIPGGGFTWARAKYDSIRGRIETSWRVKGSRFELDVTVPANTSATVFVPTSRANTATEGGELASTAEGVRYLGHQEGCDVFRVGGGTYQFRGTVPRP